MSDSDPRKQKLRSGDFSADPVFDPNETFDAVESAQSERDMSTAVGRFLDAGNHDRFARAVAVFVRAARARRQPVESVLAVLNQIAIDHEGRPQVGAEAHPTELRTLILKGVLLAFYGNEERRGTEERRRTHDRRKQDQRHND